MLNRITTALARVWSKLYLRVRFIQATRTLSRPPVYAEDGQHPVDGDAH